MISLTASEKNIQARWKKKNEVDEIPEEGAAEFANKQAADNVLREELKKELDTLTTPIKMIELESDSSLESTIDCLRSHFLPKVVLVNHEKRLGIDTTCSNLAIKFNMIYISAYQIIKHHITQQTAWGQKLLLVQRAKDINLTTQVRDEFNEQEFSPVHFDLETVVQLLRETIQEKLTTQKLVLLEGMCNSLKLKGTDDQLEVRLMDELQLIEKHVGEIAGTIGLQFAEVASKLEEKDIKWEQFN